MHGKRSLAAVTGIGVSIGACLAAGPAAARWTFHDEAATQVIAPPGGTDGQACSEGVRALSGWLVAEDPDTFVPDQNSGAYDAVTYQVWRAPDGFFTFGGDSPPRPVVDNAGNVTDYVFTDASGAEHSATKVAEVVAPPRKLLTPPERDSGTVFAFTKSAFYADLDRSVEVGDVLGLRPDLDSTVDSLIDLTASDCTFSGQGGDNRARAGRPARLTVGRITGPGAPDDYAATIAWGDGSGLSTGHVQRSGELVVVGTHRYQRRGEYRVRVTVRQRYTGTEHVSVGKVRVRPRNG